MSAEHPVIVAMLLQRLAAHNETAVPDMCPLGEDPDPACNPELHGGAWIPWVDQGPR